MSSEGGTKAVVAALLANTGIAITKLVAFLLTGASSMLAEAIHSAADSGNQLLLLLGGRAARKQADELHPFGYGAERYVYSFLVAIVLFTVGGLFALYEAYHKFHEVHAAHGRPQDSILDSQFAWVPIAVLLVAIVLEGLSFRTAMREAGKLKGQASYPQFIRRTKQPELPVILLEDTAALIGLLFALIGVGMSLITGSLYWDVVGTGLIGVLLVSVAIVLGLETKSMLLGESASPEALARIRGALEEADGIDGVVHLRTMHLGPDDLLVAVKVAVRGLDTAAEVAAAIDRAESAVRRVEPMARTLYVEPDVRR